MGNLLFDHEIGEILHGKNGFPFHGNQRSGGVILQNRGFLTSRKKQEQNQKERNKLFHGKGSFLGVRPP